MATKREATHEKVERIKREKDGLDVWDDLMRYARDPSQSIDPDDVERFKWYGMYQQRPNQGHFMLRIRIPGGRLTGTAFRGIGELARQYAHNVGDVSTRQDVQLHWLRIQDFPDVFDRLNNELGIASRFACGDVPRNVTGCPLDGIVDGPDLDTRDIARAVARMYVDGKKEFSNLPRKWKVAIAGCTLHCHAPQINCLAFFHATRKRNGTTETGLGLMAGGGLRDTPHYGQSLRVFLPPDVDLITNLCRHAAFMFRAQDALRRGRLRARFKFHVANVGWQAIRDDLERRLGHALEHDDSIVFPHGATHDDHVGIGPQRDGNRYVGVPVARGRLTGDNMITLAELATKYGAGDDGNLVSTIKQNIILLDIPPDRVGDLVGELNDAGLPPERHPLRTSLLSCTGIEFCNLATVETKTRAKEILDYLESRLTVDQPLFIAVTGCPNSCTQYQIADIGLTGVPMVVDKKRVDGFFIHVGGKLGEHPRFGRPVLDANDKKIKVRSAEVHRAIERLWNRYLDGCADRECFSDWSNRQEMPVLAGALDSAASSP